MTSLPDLAALVREVPADELPLDQDHYIATGTVVTVP